jgi:hypothetical protein
MRITTRRDVERHKAKYRRMIGACDEQPPGTEVYWAIEPVISK